MRCRLCGGLLESRLTDLPFKIGDSSIVILRSLPVLQCRQCGDTELEQATMSRVDQLLAAVGGWVGRVGGYPVRRVTGAKLPGSRPAPILRRGNVVSVPECALEFAPGAFRATSTGWAWYGQVHTLRSSDSS